jgi:hypothetical protein
LLGQDGDLGNELAVGFLRQDCERVLTAVYLDEGQRLAIAELLDDGVIADNAEVPLRGVRLAIDSGGHFFSAVALKPDPQLSGDLLTAWQRGRGCADVGAGQVARRKSAGGRRDREGDECCGGNVASIAVAVFLAGQVRRAATNSAFMIHKATNSFQFPMKADFIRERAVVLERDDQAIETTHTSIPDSDWVKYPTVDLTFGAQEAKEFGLIHEIADFTPPRDCELYNI